MRSRIDFLKLTILKRSFRMKQATTMSRPATASYYFRLFFITALLLIGIQQKANASGAKMPDVATSDTTGTMDGTVADTENPDPGGGTGSTTPTLDKYAHLDPSHEVPASLLSRALAYYDANSSKIRNKNFISIIDFKQHSSKERFYLINMSTGHVERYATAHGKNSDPDHDGYATIFSNTPSSEMSSLGFYLAAETYEGGKGYSLKLDGLSSTNSNARSRAIVIHPADYVYSTGEKIGRSWGCPALEPRFSADIINQIKGGSLIYASNVY
jgi:hypothetical protein